MRKAYKSASTRWTVFSTMFNIFALYWTVVGVFADKSFKDVMIPMEVFFTLIYTGFFFSGLLSELKFMDEYNLGLRMAMIEDQENRRKMSFDFNDIDMTFNSNKTTWNLLNTITVCLCFGVYAFNMLGNCAWWMILILIIETFVLMLVSGSVFSLYKDCRKKFKEIDKKFSERMYEQ